MLEELQNKFYHQFRDISLLEVSLSHKSYANEHRNKNEKQNFLEQHNERLEFLGDAVLQLVISDLLWERFPNVCEGALSKMRSSLVNERRLAGIANEIELGKYLKLGKGEKLTGGAEKPSILSCAYEAALGALYLDGGLEAAFRTIKLHFSRLLNTVDDREFSRDFKTKLQEWAQANHKQSPRYVIFKEDGPDHSKLFSARVLVATMDEVGSGRSKKEAEQSAARAMLDKVLATNGV